MLKCVKLEKGKSQYKVSFSILMLTDKISHDFFIDIPSSLGQRIYESSHE